MSCFVVECGSVPKGKIDKAAGKSVFCDLNEINDLFELLFHKIFSLLLLLLYISVLLLIVQLLRALQDCHTEKKIPALNEEDDG